MGPRLFRRGKSRPLQLCRARRPCFNGATPFQTWKVFPQAVTWLFSRLQWGHAFSDVESNSDRNIPLCSLELQWGHAFSDVERSISFHHTHMLPGRFNGATPFQTWKAEAARACVVPDTRLQWGHAFSDVERVCRRCRGGPARPASMGPRLFRRGKDLKPPLPPLKNKASMGPRLFRRGKRSVHCLSQMEREASMGPRLFRRGKAFVVLAVTRSLMLQWGHAFSDVESDPWPPPPDLR